MVDRDNKIYLLSDSVMVFDSGGNREFFKKGSSELMYAALTITTDGTPIFIGRKDFASFDQTIPLQLLTPRTSDMWTTLATMDEYYLWTLHTLSWAVFKKSLEQSAQMG